VCSSALPSQSTSRSDSTSPAPSLTPMVSPPASMPACLSFSAAGYSLACAPPAVPLRRGAARSLHGIVSNVYAPASLPRLARPAGNLVSNAPHLPVHLGAMSEAVKFQIQHYRSGGAGAGEGLQVRWRWWQLTQTVLPLPCRAAFLLKTAKLNPTFPRLPCHCLQEGDVLVSNHPQLAGGSHLPDITVITPVFDAGSTVFFVASRGHHAGERDITQQQGSSGFPACCSRRCRPAAAWRLPNRRIWLPASPACRYCLPACRHWRHLSRQHAPPLSQPRGRGSRHHLF
jgi:hypothetical protein